jgi:hypothetical protein
MKNALTLAWLLAALAFGAGCGRPFDVRTAPGLVELDNQQPQYAYRALAPEGVVFAVRVVDTGGRGDLEFWSRATALRMHQLDGYALLGRAEVRSRDGTPGRELRFGHDENKKPYLYTLRIYVRQKHLFLVETGGPQAEMDRYEGDLEWMQASLKLD